MKRGITAETHIEISSEDKIELRTPTVTASYPYSFMSFRISSLGTLARGPTEVGATFPNSESGRPQNDRALVKPSFLIKRQNINFNPSCPSRPGPAPWLCPNKAGTDILLKGAWKFAWFVTLKNSARNWRFSLSLIGVFFTRAVSIVKKGGILKVLFPILPKINPDAGSGVVGTAKAARLSIPLGGEAPV